MEILLEHFSSTPPPESVLNASQCFLLCLGPAIKCYDVLHPYVYWTHAASRYVMSIHYYFKVVWVLT